MMRRPRSLDLLRVIITFTRFDSGRNLAGMLSQVFRPMTTALNAREEDTASEEATWEVTFLKKAMSVLIGGQGRLP